VGEIVSDTRYGPSDLPADAVLVCAWDDSNHPSAWATVGIATGYATLDEILEACGEERPDLDGVAVMVTKVGGSSSRVRRLRRTVTASVAVDLQPV
jgi:hypothetical protein